MTTVPSSAAEKAEEAVHWSGPQQAYRRVMKALRGAYYHDRATLFWARHRVLVEFYKYAEVGNTVPPPTSSSTEEGSVDDGNNDARGQEQQQHVVRLLQLVDEVADVVETYMQTDVERIIRHNEAMMKLPVDEAKVFRQQYFTAEKQLDSWCRQRIKAILKKRPPPPYPFV